RAGVGSRRRRAPRGHAHRAAAQAPDGLELGPDDARVQAPPGAAPPPHRRALLEPESLVARPRRRRTGAAAAPVVAALGTRRAVLPAPWHAAPGRRRLPGRERPRRDGGL